MNLDLAALPGFSRAIQQRQNAAEGSTPVIWSIGEMGLRI